MSLLKGVNKNMLHFLTKVTELVIFFFAIGKQLCIISLHLINWMLEYLKQLK